ncbi:MAG: type II secretion system protein GspG [Pirellulales bacterium]
MIRKQKPRRRNIIRSAFTLMEVMLVLVIIAAIAGLAIRNYAGAGESANRKIAKGKISELQTAVDMYKLEMMSLPPDLDALYTKPANASSNWYQFLKAAPGNDPWGHPFQYSASGDSYEIRSLGKDGTISDDDIL